MFKKMFFTLFVLSIFVLFISCQESKDEKGSQQKSADSIKTDNTKKKPAKMTGEDASKEKSGSEILTEEIDTELSNQGGLLKTKGQFYSNYKLSEFINMGAEVILRWPFETDFDVSRLITYAKDPYQIIVCARNYSPWVLSDFAEKGTRIVVPSWLFTDFETRAIINYAPDNKKNNITVIPQIGNWWIGPTQTLKYVEMGARVKVTNRHQPFDIVNYIDEGWKLHNKPLVEVKSNGFNSYWIEQFILRGGNIFINEFRSSFDVMQFAKVANETKKGKVKINGLFYTTQELEWFLKYNAKIIVGRTTSNVFRDAFRVSELIKKNPSHVIVLGDFFEAHHIAEFIRLGGKVIFKFLGPDNQSNDIDKYQNPTPPPDRPVMSKPN